MINAIRTVVAHHERLKSKTPRTGALSSEYLKSLYKKKYGDRDAEEVWAEMMEKQEQDLAEACQ